MTERSRYLVEGFIDQTLGEAELSELKQLIRDDPETGQVLSDAVHLHGLADTVQHNDYSELVLRVDESISDLSPNQLEQTVLKSIEKQSRFGKRLLPMWGLAIAAQVLIRKSHY